VNKWPNTKEI